MQKYFKVREPKQPGRNNRDLNINYQEKLLNYISIRRVDRYSI